MSQGQEHFEEDVSLEEESTAVGVSRGLSGWKIVLLSLALLMGITGMIFHPENSDEEETRTVGNLSSSTADSLLSPHAFQSTPDPTLDSPGSQMAETPRDPLSPDWERRLEAWSPLLTKLGFSFVVGFSIGYVLLIFLRTTAFIAGLVILALFGLQYLGVLYVNWNNIETSYNSVLGWILPQAENFRDFITSNLSSSGMTAMGILTGLTRR